MAMMGFIRNFRPLEILGEEQVELIARGTLQVLEETGLRIEHERALKLLQSNGCSVDYDKMMVRIRPGLVGECLSKCPSSYLVRARDPKHNLFFGGNVTYFKNSAGMRTIDLDTWEPRVPTRKENEDAVRVLDSLENLHVLGPYTPYFGFEGVPPAMAIPESCAAKMRDSAKVQMEGCSDESELFQIQMAQAVGAEIIHVISSSPPLTWSRAAIDALFRTVEAGFPIHDVAGQVFGGTAPVTLAGALVTSNACIMVPIVLAQIIRPGTRVLAAVFDFPLNMRSGSPAFGAIGSSLHLAAFHQMWRRYGLPTHSCTCGYVSSKHVDFQAGYEKAIQATVAGMSGANLIGLHGAVSAELTFHPVQAIMDDDVAGMVGRFLRGTLVNEETLALDVIHRVGPIPGHYMGEEHTRKWWMSEDFIPKVADRLGYPEWLATGKRTALEYARERMERILESHQPKPLTSGQEAEIKRILEEARKYYKKQGKL